MSEQETSLNSSADRSSRYTDDAISTKDLATIGKAKTSISETKVSANEQFLKGNISQSQKDSIDKQMDAQTKALEYAQYQTGGGNAAQIKSWTSPKDAHGNVLKNPDGKDVSTPKEAVDYYNAQAKTIQSERTASGNSIAQLSKQGIKPGQNLSDEQAKEIVIKSRSSEETAKINAARDTSDKHEDFDKAQDQKDTKAAAEYKTNVANLKTNKNSSAWHQAYQNKLQQSQIYAGVGTALAQTMNGVGNMENELYQAQGTKDAAAAQVEGATVQSMSTGISNTESVAQQIRSNLAAVAQDMSTMVSSTRV